MVSINYLQFFYENFYKKFSDVKIRMSNKLLKSGKLLTFYSPLINLYIEILTEAQTLLIISFLFKFSKEFFSDITIKISDKLF